MAMQNKSDYVFSDGVVWDQPFFVDLLLVFPFFYYDQSEEKEWEKQITKKEAQLKWIGISIRTYKNNT